MKTAIINARVQPDLKEDAEAILSRLGITATQAITMFYEQIRMNKGIPFELKIPDVESQALEGALDYQKRQKPSTKNIGAIALRYFGQDNGVDLELPPREVYEPVSFD